MDRNVSYILVGFIFCALVIAMSVFVVWVGTSGVDSSKGRVYRSYTDDDMTGIVKGTLVRYKGIVVGSVLDVKFKEKKSGTVQVDIAIDKDIPVSVGSEIMVSSKGIMGPTYLSLINGDSPNIIDNDEEAILIFKRSSLSKALDNAEGVVHNVKSALDDVKGFMDPKNMDKIMNIMDSFKSTGVGLDMLIGKTHDLIHELNKLAKDGKFDFTKFLSPVLRSVQDSFNSMSEFFTVGTQLLHRFGENPYETLLGKQEQTP